MGNRIGQFENHWFQFWCLLNKQLQLIRLSEGSSPAANKCSQIETKVGICTWTEMYQVWLLGIYQWSDSNFLSLARLFYLGAYQHPSHYKRWLLSPHWMDGCSRSSPTSYSMPPNSFAWSYIVPHWPYAARREQTWPMSWLCQALQTITVMPWIKDHYFQSRERSWIVTVNMGQDSVLLKWLYQIPPENSFSLKPIA